MVLEFYVVKPWLKKNPAGYKIREICDVNKVIRGNNKKEPSTLALRIKLLIVGNTKSHIHPLPKTACSPPSPRDYPKTSPVSAL